MQHDPNTRNMVVTDLPFRTFQIFFQKGEGSKLCRKEESINANAGAETILGQHGGTIYAKGKRRAYDGARPFSGKGKKATKRVYKRIEGQKNCRFWVVITTIFAPTQLSKQLVKMPLGRRNV